MKSSSLFITAAALSLSTSAAFTAPKTNLNTRTLTSLNASSDGKTFAASVLTSAYLLTGLLSADAAFAADAYSTQPSFVDSSIVVAARSGGRAGGRSAPRPASRSVAPSSSSKTVINRSTTVIQAPPVVVGGGYGYGGYGGYGYYDPTPGIALNLGLSAVSAVGNGMREYRQESEIARSRAELGAAKEREAEMAERIRALEQMQMQQGRGQMAPQVIYAQPPVQGQVLQAVPQQ
jgi:hypothetical protein